MMTTKAKHSPGLLQGGRFNLLAILVLIVFAGANPASVGNISLADKWAWSENAGWINFRPTAAGVFVYADHLEGYAWAENIGYLKLGSYEGGGSHVYGNTTPTDWGVNRFGSTLSGYAWSENAGWVNFSPTHGGVTVDSATGRFDGYAWGESIGWIHFQNASPAYRVAFAVPTSTLLNSTPNPSAFGQTVTLSAAVTAESGTAVGVVNFFDGAALLGTSPLNGAGVATLNLSTLAGSVHGLTAVYPATGVFETSTSITRPHTVNAAATSTTLATTPNPSAFGETVTLTATVLPTPPGGGAPAGTVTFYDDGTSLGTVPLSAGTATLSTGLLAVGSHPLTAEYSGSSDHAASTSPAATQTVNRRPTTTALASTVNPSVYGQTVILTATVSVPPLKRGTFPSPSGTVTFYDGAVVLGTGGLVGDAATLNLSTLPVGLRSLTAAYGGDDYFQTSTSPACGHTVNKADAIPVVASDVNPTVFGQAVTFTASVQALAPGGGVPTGTVTFLDGATTLGTGTLSGGTAVFTTAALSVGPHPVTARYEGDAFFNPGASPTPILQTVNKTNTTTTLASSPNPSVYGQGVTFTATVSVAAPGAGAPTGAMTFFDGATPLGTGTLVGNTATFSTSLLAVGPHLVTARFEGDGRFNPSTASAVTQTVDKADTTVTLTDVPNPSVFGQEVTFTATVAVTAPGSGIPTGTVTFLDGTTVLGTGTLVGSAAAFTTSTLTVGAHPVSARYEGDGPFNAHLSPVASQVVNSATTTTTLVTSPNPVCPGEELTLTATVAVVLPGAGTPTGTVTFLDGATALGTGALAGGPATFVTTALTAGTHALSVRYEGDGAYAASTAEPVSQVVNQDAGVAAVDGPAAVCAGERATLTARTTGTGPFAFAWSQSADGVTFTTIPGATGTSYTTPPLEAKRVYKVELAGTCGTASKIVIVEATQPPAVASQPVDVSTPSWRSATLTVTYTGTEIVSIQWYEGETGDTSHPVENATGTVFRTPALDRDAVYWARLSNGCGTADTEAAAVTVLNEYCLPHAASTALWWTTLAMVNAGATAQPVSLDAYGSDGVLLEHRDLDPIGPGAQWELDAEDLFSAATLAQDFWVKVTSKANLKGLLSFGTRDHTSRTALGFMAEGHRELAFPYVALTGPEAGAYYTGLTLVNVGAAPAAVRLEAYAESGAKLGASTVTIPPNGKYVRLLEEAFPDISTPQLIRSVTAASEQPLAGFELFGTLLAQGLSGLPAVGLDDPPENGLYHGMCYAEIPPNPAWYTGLTFVNLDPKPALVTGMVYDASGAPLGTASWELQPMEQLTREVWELLDPATYGTAAHAILGSYQRVSGFELVLSRVAPFRFDGLAGIVQGSDRLVFSWTPTGTGESTRIRLINKSDRRMTATVTAYDGAGLALGTYPLTLAACQTADLNAAAAFPSALGNVAWIGVEGDNILFGDAFVETDGGQPLVIYSGQPCR